MKKLLHKIRRHKEVPPSRITSETVAEHRERILAGGRKFKYPIQYARHKLVINAIIISLVALIAVVAVGWWQLYKAQNTSEFMYRITKVIPVPIATVDGQFVPYSDYLMKYISSVRYLEQKEQVIFKTDDGKRQLKYIKEQSFADSIADAYATKMAKKLGLSISDSELEGFIKAERQSSDGEISEQTYDAVILDYYGWSPTEFRYVTKNKLLRQKVTYSMDKNAQTAASNAETLIKGNSGVAFKDIAVSVSTQSKVKAVYGTSGWVSDENQDGGLAATASKMKKGQISSIIKPTTGDGYYIIKLVDVKEAKISYEYIKIPLTVFNDAFKKVTDDGKVKKFISL